MVRMNVWVCGKNIIGLLTSPHDERIRSIPHKLWSNTHETAPYPVRHMLDYRHRVCTLYAPYPICSAIIYSGETMTAITGDNIDLFRMSVLEKALKLELLGMKGRGRSAYSVIKSEYGLKGNRQTVYDKFRQLRLEQINP